MVLVVSSVAIVNSLVVPLFILAAIGILLKTYSESVTVASILIVIFSILIAIYPEYKFLCGIFNLVLGLYIAYKGRSFAVFSLGLVVALLSFLTISWTLG